MAKKKGKVLPFPKKKKVDPENGIPEWSPALLAKQEDVEPGHKFTCAYCNEEHELRPGEELSMQAAPNMLLYKCQGQVYNGAIDGKFVVGVEPDVYVEMNPFMEAKMLLAQSMNVHGFFFAPLSELENSMTVHTEKIQTDDEGNVTYMPPELLKEPELNMTLSLTQLQMFRNMAIQIAEFLKAHTER